MLKRLCTDLSHACWQNELLETTVPETVYSNLLESVREPNARQPLTVIKRRILNALKAFGEINFGEIAANIERFFLDRPQLASFLELDF